MDTRGNGGKNNNQTIKDVAQALNVSTTTVSRAISGKGRISEETVRRVREYIQENNYVPNAIAQSLADQRTYNIGFLVPGVEAVASQSFFRGCLTGLCQALADTPYDVLMILEDGSGSRLARALEKRKLDGAIVSRALTDDRTCAQLTRAGVPFVLIGSSPDRTVCQVDHDHRSACAGLTRRLLTGRRKLALLGGDQRLFVTQDRLQGFLDAHREAALPVADSQLYFDLDRGPQAAAALDAALADGAQCLVCMDDQIAGVVLSLLHHRELRIPQDIQVASFYDSFLLETYTPAITALQFDAQALGAAACRLLLDQLEGRKLSEIELVGHSIALRASTEPDI